MKNDDVMLKLKTEKILLWRGDNGSIHVKCGADGFVMLECPVSVTNAAMGLIFARMAKWAALDGHPEMADIDASVEEAEAEMEDAIRQSVDLGASVLRDVALVRE